ncbi:aminoacyl-tRNA hydrolase [Candidatus Sneabacter namystus]|uniref:Peptidyl-tRNA hydrolase n=1 Tax=Candidatus Sneabacter namystus TaxID=2601646 RepID=A0A5C0UH85_9RICK|nr:aminoacyl-tRNA hydrolase [Candidatus Sneabacter namystus]QEK39478.1 aminoacyl-tRNA hydrolase [Candidatus Sneabacter namystus]
MILVCGLGNVGTTYRCTRHNVGFFVVDMIAKQYCEEFTFCSKFDAFVAKLSINACHVTLVKPSLLMNNSGVSLGKVVHYYKVDPDKVIVIHDDIDLALGRVKLKKAGSAGGHNGIKSIDTFLGNEYWRIRIGIGRPDFGDVSNYVLSRFSGDELTVIKEITKFIAQSFDLGEWKDIRKYINERLIKKQHES